MSGGGGPPAPPEPPPASGGEFLLKLLQKPQSSAAASRTPSSLPGSDPLFPIPNHHDPAVAAVGPSIPFPPWPNPEMRPFFVPYPQPPLPPGMHPGGPWPLPGAIDLHGSHLLPKPAQFLPDGSNHQLLGFPPNLGHPRNGLAPDTSLTFGSLHCEFQSHRGFDSATDGFPNPPLASERRVLESQLMGRGSNRSSVTRPAGSGFDNTSFVLNRGSHQPKEDFNSLEGDHLLRGRGRGGSSGKEQNASFRRTGGAGNGRQTGQPHSQSEMDQRASAKRGEKNARTGTMYRQTSPVSVPLSIQLDRPGLPSGSSLHSAPGSAIQDSFVDLHVEESEEDHIHKEAENLPEQFTAAVVLDEESENRKKEKAFNRSRGKDMRTNISRGFPAAGQRMRNRRRELECRSGIDRLTPSFLSIYESLIPAEEEKANQKQLLASLEKLVNREWPNAKLYLYGSCANSFGVSNSDIDVCLAIDEDINKANILLKLAEILESDNLQNVQALPRARVPIVKLMDPITGISCDICINNILAVVNTKLLRDYAKIDARLRQLAFIVKHWAKSRGVNETYRGTLSSYAYVLMCIHFLQQRHPAILPCLQEMEATYVETVDDIECSFFDEVESLSNFGARNKESIARLLWGFFDYWAFRHDYANAVISIRTGSIISKRVKDWTRRIGNDRHLICIEDPFETSHDLGRVVDKHSIKILREEFERAAYILQNDPDPSIALFEPYIPDDLQ